VLVFELVVVVLALVVVVRVVAFEVLVLVEEEATVEEVTLPPNKLITLVYAGLVEKSSFQRHASPCPLNVLGIQLYLSV
jgi:hypothetical protein